MAVSAPFHSRASSIDPGTSKNYHFPTSDQVDPSCRNELLHCPVPLCLLHSVPPGIWIFKRVSRQPVLPSARHLQVKSFFAPRRSNFERVQYCQVFCLVLLSKLYAIVQRSDFCFFLYSLRFCMQGHYLVFQIPRKQNQLRNSRINCVENLSCSGLIKHVHVVPLSLWLHATFALVSTIIQGKNLINSSREEIVVLYRCKLHFDSGLVVKTRGSNTDAHTTEWAIIF